MKFHIQGKEISKKSEAGEPQCWVWTWPGSFPSHLHLLLDAFFWRALWFKPHAERSQHGLPACPLCSCVVTLLANEPLPSPSPAQILAAAALLQPDTAPFGPGCPRTTTVCLTAQCRRVGLCPARDHLQKISTRRPCFLQLPLNSLPEGKRLVAEATKAGFWTYMAKISRANCLARG